MIKKMFLFVYYLAFTVFYAGFIFIHKVYRGSLGRYSILYSLLVMVLAFGFFVPPLILFIKKKIGTKKMLFIMIPSVVLIIIIYSFSSYRYYYAQKHLFEPFLQTHPPSVVPSNWAKPENTFRILALGGSTTKNMFVPSEKKYTSVLKSILQARYPEINIEVFNGGESWYTTKHSLINYVTNMRDWHPDLVVVMHAINDLMRSYSPPLFAIPPYNRNWSHFYGPSVKGAKPPSFEQHLFFQNFWRLWFSKYRLHERNFPLKRYLSLKDYERNLGNLFHYIKSDGVKVIFMTQPSLYKEDMSSEELNPCWIYFKVCNEKIEGTIEREFSSIESIRLAMEAFNRVAQETAISEQVAVLDLESMIAKDLSNFVDDVHFTENATQQIAEAVAKKIIQEQIIVRTDIR